MSIPRRRSRTVTDRTISTYPNGSTNHRRCGSVEPADSAQRSMIS